MMEVHPKYSSEMSFEMGMTRNGTEFSIPKYERSSR